MCLGHGDAGETQRRGFAQFLGGEVALLVPALRVRQQPVAGEGTGGGLKGDLLLGQGEIHGGSLTPATTG